jgi:hypothetical protein
MKKTIYFALIVVFTTGSGYITAQDFTDIHIDRIIENVQPMTGIVFWRGDNTNTDVVSLEFSYMLFNQVVADSGVYNWDIVETYLDDIASRSHQAIFRFRYVYVGEETSVPDYIKARPDYNETEGISEGQLTWFPDWTNEELKRFSLEFYTKFAEKYDNDPRIAFIQVGFGLWAEYHIYDGPFELGVTFPSKEFQTEFFHHLDTTFVTTPFSISIDAASDTYSPFSADTVLYNISFGLFDDSFMHEEFGQPGEYNTESWNFFDRDRYLWAPAGGEFSYYSSYDQQHVLDWPDGPYGHPFEYFAADFHISYIIGNDQPQYQTLARIKQAGLACGYKFKLKSLKANDDSTVAVVINQGDAPIYYDAYIAIDGVRSPVSLKLLAPGEEMVCGVSTGGYDPQVTIESDRLVPGQSIGFFGTENNLGFRVEKGLRNEFRLFPTVIRKGGNINIERTSTGNDTVDILVFDMTGRQIISEKLFSSSGIISTANLTDGLYVVKISDDNGLVNSFKIVVK